METKAQSERQPDTVHSRSFQMSACDEGNADFLMTAIRVFNLAIFAVSSSWFAILIHAMQLGIHWLCLDIVCNALAMYLSFAFANKLYFVFCACCSKNRFCVSKCAYVCFCCCIPNSLPNDVQTAIEVNSKQHTTRQHSKSSIALSVETPSSKPMDTAAVCAQ
mmetsp:Transcript_26690/g.42285  ORF Transcript_26690/g.42285 Transcript_26690/m.42285 type:complete len:163 (+) Transcript_26690:1-489(+)